MTNLTIGIVSLIIALVILTRKKPFKHIFLSKLIGFDMYFRPISYGLRFLIVIPLFICGLFFLWMESIWYFIIAFAVWLIVNFIVATLNSEGAKVTKIFNIYKGIKSLGTEKNEVALVLRTAFIYYKRKGYPLDYIEQKISDLPKDVTENILRFVEYLLIAEDNYDSGSKTFDEIDKRRKVIEHSYYSVFKTRGPYY